MLTRDKYLRTVRRPYPPLFFSLILAGLRNTNNFQGIINEAFSMHNLAKVDEIWYYDTAEITKSGELAFVAWSEHEVFEKVKKEFDNREKRLLESSLKSFKEFCEAFKCYMPALLLVSTVEESTEKNLRIALEQAIQKDEVRKIVNILNIPLQDNYYKKEIYDLLTADNLEDHVKKYEWLLARYGDKKIYTVEDARNKLQNTDKQKFLNELQTEKETIIKAVSQANELLGEQKYLIDIFQYIVFYRTHRSDVINRAIFQALPMLELLAQEKRITYDQLLQATFEEIINNKIPSVDILNSRKNCCSVILEDDIINCFHNGKAKEIEEFFYEKKDNVKKINGIIASKGAVTGTVKIIYSRKDFSKIEEGDILVTSMTTVDMIPIMKIAAAFVTDEGGITCHAAIVSRELKKPCIIATKIATQVLKDGDLVEVDAARGIVNLINN